MTRERAQTDYFSRDPHRLVDALLRGELSWHAYAVVSFLINVIDHGRETRPFTAASLDDLHRHVRFPLSTKTLLRALKEAREASWIDFTTPKGSARAYSFTLSKASIDGLAGHAGVSTDPLAGQQDVSPVETSDGSGEAATQLGEGDLGDSLAGHPRARAKEAYEKEKTSTDSLTAVGRAAAIAASAGVSDPDVLYEEAKVTPSDERSSDSVDAIQPVSLDEVLDAEIAHLRAEEVLAP